MALGEGWRTRAVRWLRRRLPPPLRRAIEDASGQDIPLHAAGLAFFALVSLIPLTIVAMWVASLVAGEGRVERLAQALAAIAPRNLGADRALIRVAELGTSLGVVAIVAALAPATAYGSGLARAFRRLSPKDPPEELRGVLGRGLLLLVVVPLFVLGTMLAAFAATSLFEEALLRALGWVLALALAFLGGGLAAALIYRVFPPEALPWRAVLRGAAVSGAGVALLTVAFAAIVGLGADFTKYYAMSGLAGIVLLATWLFVANAALLTGYRVALRAAR
ncbi:MAG TPA: YhjD/YihY/BrkB family envelope integrity protein [Actinomycetota bacterium]|nr:YhjD/YihY/BrkB family envelope integrity protein [Actinomycetota bacterium]